MLVFLFVPVQVCWNLSLYMSCILPAEYANILVFLPFPGLEKRKRKEPKEKIKNGFQSVLSVRPETTVTGQTDKKNKKEKGLDGLNSCAVTSCFPVFPLGAQPIIPSLKKRDDHATMS